MKDDHASDIAIETYTRYAPYVIVVAGVVGALIGGAGLWVIPIVIVVSAIYAYFKVKATRRGMRTTSNWVNRRLRDKDDSDASGNG